MQNTNSPRAHSYNSHGICIPQLKLTATCNSRVFHTTVDPPSDLEIGICSPLHIKKYVNALKEALIETCSCDVKYWSTALQSLQLKQKSFDFA